MQHVISARKRAGDLKRVRDFFIGSIIELEYFDNKDD